MIGQLRVGCAGYPRKRADAFTDAMIRIQREAREEPARRRAYHGDPAPR
jgi:hypothetical protein